MFAILLPLLLGTSSMAAGTEQEPFPKDVVATINGQEILLEEILPEPEAVNRSFFAETGQKPQSDRDSAVLADIRLRLQRQGLSFQFRERLRQAALKRFEIEVADEEIAVRKKEILNRSEIKASEPENLKQMERLIQALLAIQGGVPEREAYDRFGLDSESPFDFFQLQVMEYGSPEKIQALRSVLDDYRTHGIASSPGWDVTARAELTSEKLDAKIDGELALTDVEVMQRLKEQKPADSDSALQLLKKQDPLFLGQKRREWWLRQFAKADIQIFREDLKAAVELFKSGL